MKLHNSLTGDKEEFRPLNPPHVGIYVCGPTVYGHSHLGHGKSYVSFDVLVRYLRYLGYKVRYVQNITDVGHLTDDADAGEDKIEKQARLEKLEPMQIVEKYTRSYFRDMDALNVLRPDISPRASGHIPEQIELIKTLLEKGHAYESGGNVYYSIASFPDYGKLSGRKVDDLMAGARVEIDGGKRDPRDFALWKKADEDHILKWNSPWGWGYPGWHLECSSMSMRYIGDTLDIHAGGLENIFPHHESEIAQSEGATGEQFARFWLHNNMVTVNGRKMGKSLGNFTLLRDIFEKYHPMVVRLYILRSHYRSPLDFSDEGLESAESGFQRLVSFRDRLKSGGEDGNGEPSKSVMEIANATAEEFRRAMDDDLNTPEALAAVFELVRRGNGILDTEDTTANRSVLASLIDELAEEVLGLDLTGYSSSGEDTEELCRVLAEARAVLRKNGLYEAADRMRDQLDDMGYSVKDTADGGTITRK
ncbi:MAG: cysteine--tRNA ligase [Candidatus Aegiribacteria sp.]|nr:cysteine--tRNA ligase [Candidatus Aegiribacteria sp.]MBD3294061.1 cysteine--tRNA ligase [Candidatus Fermentibacteria bacterium]